MFGGLGFKGFYKGCRGSEFVFRAQDFFCLGLIVQGFRVEGFGGLDLSGLGLRGFRVSTGWAPSSVNSVFFFWGGSGACRFTLYLLRPVTSFYIVDLGYGFTWSFLRNLSCHNKESIPYFF